MTLRQRTALAVLAACAALTALVLSSVWSNLNAAAADLERQGARRSLERATRALSEDVAGLSATVAAWAQRDDSCQFMQDGNSRYAAANLNPTALANLDVDFVVYVDTDGEIFHSTAAAPGDTPGPLPSGIEAFVTGDGLLASHDSETGSVAGVLFLPDHLAIAASRPIVTAELQGPMAGSLIMGRFLDEAELRKLSRATGLSLELHRVDERDLPEDFLVARSSLTPDEDTLVRVLDGRAISSYKLVSEINGSPAFVLGVEEPRDTFAAAQAAGRRTMALLLGICVLFSLAVVLGIDVLVGSRLRRFRKSVEAMAETRSPSDRVAVGGRDEVSAAADLVNQSLDSLERSRQDLAVSQARNRALVEAIPDLVFRITRQGSILETRRPQGVAPFRDPHDDPGGRSRPDEVSDLIPTEAQHIVMPHVRKALESGQTQIFEFQMSVDGSVTYHEGRVLANGDEEAVVIVRDVTDQKVTEGPRQTSQLLREIHRRVRSHLQVIRSFPDAQKRRTADTSPPGAPAPGPAAPAEGMPLNTEASAGGTQQGAGESAEGTPLNTEAAAEGTPLNMEAAAEGTPLNMEAAAEGTPRRGKAADAVPTAKGR